VNAKIEDLMYHAGLTASGCWDEMDSYDHQAIEKLVELIIDDCAGLVENEGRFLKFDKLAAKLRDTYGKPN
jgi:hypothetical protein